MARATANNDRGRAATVKAGATPAAPVAASNAAASVTEVKPSADQIRARAYQIYCERCDRGVAGDAGSDWLRAEAELRRR